MPQPLDITALKARYTKRELWYRFKPQIIEDCLHGLDVELWPDLEDGSPSKQRQIVESNARIKVVRSSRRTAKSWTEGFIHYSLIYFGGLFEFQMNQAIIVPQNEDAIHFWRYFKRFWEACPISDIFPWMEITYENWDSQIPKMEVKFRNGSVIKTCHCQDSRMNSVRGNAYDYASVDEFGQVPYKERTLSAILLCLKDQEPLNLATIFGTSDVTVDMGQTFTRLFEAGQKDDNEGRIESWTMNVTENPYRDIEGDALNKELLLDDDWLREAQGEAVPVGGRMFSDLNVKRQIVPQLFNPELPLIVGADFGFIKPVIEFFQTEGDVFPDITVRVLAELSPNQILIGDLVDEIRLMIATRFMGIEPTIIGSDPAGLQRDAKVTFTDFSTLKEAFPTATYTHRPALVSKSNQVLMLRMLMKKDCLYIDPSCVKLKSAVINATRDMSVQTGAIASASWKKVKGIDDPLDALCYGMINWQPTAQLCLVREKQKPSREEAERKNQELSRLLE